MSGEMKTREFFAILLDLVRGHLPAPLKDFQVVGPTMNLVKLHYGHPNVHYEVWIQRRKGEVELGLHFEGDPASNFQHLEFLGQRLDAIRSVLGHRFVVEEWDKGWTRGHEAIPLEPLTDDFLFELSLKLSGMMQTLEPLLRSLGRP